MQIQDPRSEFLNDVLTGLEKPRKEISCKYFYDEKGSALFDRICELPEYYVTRTELHLTQKHARQMAKKIGTDSLLIEFGSGNCTKVRLLLDQLKSPSAYVPVDRAKDEPSYNF